MLKKIKSLNGLILGDAVTKLQRFVWIFNYVSRVIAWSLFNFRAPNLFKEPISTWPFIWWRQFIDKFEFETRPSSLRNSEMANPLSLSGHAISAFGRLCRKTVTQGRDDTRAWYQETMFSQVVSYDFSLHGPCTNIFCTSPPHPRNPERLVNQEGYLRCSKRFNPRSDFISFFIIRV